MDPDHTDYSYITILQDSDAIPDLKFQTKTSMDWHGPESLIVKGRAGNYTARKLVLTGP